MSYLIIAKFYVFLSAILGRKKKNTDMNNWQWELFIRVLFGYANSNYKIMQTN